MERSSAWTVAPAKAVKLVIAIDRDQHAGDTPQDGDAPGDASDTAVKTASEVAASGTANQNFHSVSSQAADAGGEAGREQEPPLAVAPGW